MRMLLCAAGFALLAANGELVKRSVAEAWARTEAVVRDPVTRCSELAPGDPYEEAANDEAYKVCQEALKAAANDDETKFRLALSAIQINRFDEAVAVLKPLAEGGHCGANYWLGEQAWYRDRDATKAERYYDRAARCGDARAKRQVFGDSFFSQSAYPEYLRALYDSDLNRLNERTARFVTASYVAGFYEALSEQFLGPDFDPCWASQYYRGGDTMFRLQAAEKGDAENVVEGWLYEKTLPIVYQILFPEQGTKALEERRAALRKAGHADLIRMAKSSECGAPGPHKLLLGVTRFAAARRPLRDVLERELPSVQSLADLQRLARGSDGRSY